MLTQEEVCAKVADEQPGKVGKCVGAANNPAKSDHATCSNSQSTPKGWSLEALGVGSTGSHTLLDLGRAPHHSDVGLRVLAGNLPETLDDPGSFFHATLANEPPGRFGSEKEDDVLGVSK